MTDAPESRHDTAGRGSGLRDQFPGYFLPSDKEIRTLITEGLVAFDTNALFDLYRFNKQARGEYLASMRLLAARLWVPNRVAEEMLDRRLEVIRECSQAIAKLTGDLDGTFETLRQHIRSFGNRRGLSPETRGELEIMINNFSADLLVSASNSFTFELNVDNSIRTDPILSEIELLLDGRVGLPLSNAKEEMTEGRRRIEERIPPGYADDKKNPDKAIGDYFIWKQLLIEAKRRSLPVILVTNDQKEDWVREYQGRLIGPRPELVSELLQQTGQRFHMMSVKSFLLHAQKYLGATVSDSTVQQAEQFSIDYEQLGSIMAGWARLEEAVLHCMERASGARLRPQDAFKAMRDYEQVAHLSPDEVDQFKTIRAFRNKLAHSADYSFTSREQLDNILALIEEHILKANSLIP